LNKLLIGKLADNIQNKQILGDELSNRLFGTMPDGIAPMKDLMKSDEIKVVQDKVELYPSFYKILYCSLDYSLLLL